MVVLFVATSAALRVCRQGRRQPTGEQDLQFAE